jgi:hypothetical protein
VNEPAFRGYFRWNSKGVKVLDAKQLVVFRVFCFQERGGAVKAQSAIAADNELSSTALFSVGLPE